jgi:hypothetical protein
MAVKDVPVMQLPTWMAEPSWFLVTGLAWPEGQDDAEIAEAAFAIAPSVTQVARPVGPDGEPVPLGRDLARMLDAGSRCAVALAKRVIFLSDITRWLGDVGLSWERVGVDFPAAQNELEHQAVGLYLELSQRAYTILCSIACTLTIHYTSGDIVEAPPEERELLRAKLETALNAGWSGYVTQALAKPPAA